ncbi:hypothetical protein B0A50_07474 [Salinomyces thailandicus]|uniref:Pex19-domain-containing protein n=1 Tax=Salinomyces thailandicus TaxID=706561 RepID=A0A4U0TNF3_9PEZI|nr:hypothetical protein B0A50_07474 [Salinomyces thailandica]
MAEKATQDPVDAAPDPEEDDLDDLDDVLDQFQPKPASSASAATAAAPSASGPGRPQHDQPGLSNAAATGPTKSNEEDFAKQLQAGMQNLAGELDENPEMQRQFEQMMRDLIAAGAAPTDKEAGEHLQKAAEDVPKATGSKAAGGSGAAGGGDFNDTIRRTMERMQASGDAATAASTSAEPSEDDMLAQMLRELQAGGGGGEGGEEDFSKMLMSMMSQLTNKEILYEPMKELDGKFPAWLAQHEQQGDVEAEEMARYREQQRLVGEIVGRFERKTYKDENEADREYIVERMQKMQAQGSPPPDLVGDMSAAQEAIGGLDDGCPQQ